MKYYIESIFNNFFLFSFSPLLSCSWCYVQCSWYWEDPDVACGGMENMKADHLAYNGQSIFKKQRYWRILNSSQRNHVNSSSSLFQHRGRSTISFCLSFPSLDQIRILKCHHTSPAPTASSFLLPPLSVLSLITESGKPFSLPRINILAFTFVIVS